MATTFPQQLQTFETALDITASDGVLIAQYQKAKEDGNLALAAQILAQIPQASKKMLTADKFNTITDTCYALERYYAERYSPAYVVSASQPAAQEIGDFWFEVV